MLRLKLTHWGRATHICVGNLTINGSDNGLSPGRRQAIILTNAGILLIGPIETNFSEMLIEILTFSLEKMRSKVSSAKRRPFCLGLNVLIKEAEAVCTRIASIVWYSVSTKTCHNKLISEKYIYFIQYISNTIVLHICLQEHDYIDGLAQDCSNSSALAMALLQSCTKSSIICATASSLIYIDSYWLWPPENEKF